MIISVPLFNFVVSYKKFFVHFPVGSYVVQIWPSCISHYLHTLVIILGRFQNTIGHGYHVKLSIKLKLEIL